MPNVLPPDEADRPLRVVFCITELDDGGAERALVQIATRLDSGGDGWPPHEVAVVCLGPEAPLAAPLREAGIRVTCLGWSKPWHLLRRRRLRDAIMSHQPDAVVSFLFHANVSTRLCRLGVPVVASHRVAERGASWHLLLERWTAGRAMRHVAVSEGVRKRLIEAGIAKNAVVIPNGVDFERFANATPDPELWEPDTFRLLAVGRLHEQKGFGELIDVIRQVDGPVPIHLVIAGDGPLRGDLQDKLKKDTAREDTDTRGRSATCRITLAGRIEDLPPLYRAADLFVLSSRWEGMPNVLLEAAAAGCPIFAAAVEGVREVVGDEATVVPADWRKGDVAAVVIEQLTQLAETQQLDDGRTIREAADSLQRSVRQRFTWDAAAQRYAAVVADVVSPAG